MTTMSQDEIEALTLEEVQDLLDTLHEQTGWDFGITLTASTHVQWNAEIRVTPHPFEEDSSDRSLVTYRVGPPDWAASRALGDMLVWLDTIAPPHSPEPCFACQAPRDPDGGEDAEDRAYARGGELAGLITGLGVTAAGQPVAGENGWQPGVWLDADAAERVIGVLQRLGDGHAR
jgi:hypothetical protein